VGFARQVGHCHRQLTREQPLMADGQSTCDSAPQFASLNDIAVFELMLRPIRLRGIKFPDRLRDIVHAVGRLKVAIDVTHRPHAAFWARTPAVILRR
jgi:hypothetical protein